MIPMTGKTVLITGGSQGIAKAAAIIFAEAGRDVAINSAIRKESEEVLFLASSLAQHITGEILDVNGGSVFCG